MNVERDVFVDTSAFIAMRVTDDINHTRASDFLKTIREKKLLSFLFIPQCINRVKQRCLVSRIKSKEYSNYT